MSFKRRAGKVFHWRAFHPLQHKVISLGSTHGQSGLGKQAHFALKCIRECSCNGLPQLPCDWSLQLLTANRRKQQRFHLPWLHLEDRHLSEHYFQMSVAPAYFLIEPWTCENWLCFHLECTLQARTQIFLTVACNYYNKIKVPKLGALCKVMSRITRVPKQDHIRRNCCATFFKEPCLLAATCKKTDMSDMEKLLLLPAIQLNDAHSHLLFFILKNCLLPSSH